MRVISKLVRLTPFGLAACLIFAGAAGAIFAGAAGAAAIGPPLVDAVRNGDTESLRAAIFAGAAGLMVKAAGAYLTDEESRIMPAGGKSFQQASHNPGRHRELLEWTPRWTEPSPLPPDRGPVDAVAHRLSTIEGPTANASPPWGT